VSESLQESLANAKVNASQPWYIGHNSLAHNLNMQRNNSVADNADNHIDNLHSFSRRCFPKMRSSAKFRENLNL